MIKTVITTMISTLMAVAFALYLVASAGMSVLGFTLLSPAKSAAYATSIKAAEKLGAVKQRALKRKSKVTKRFGKRAGKRLAASAASAATIGTAAVIVTVSVIEAQDYCSELEEVNADIAFLEDQTSEFDYDQCLEQAKDDMSSATDELWQKFKLGIGDSMDWLQQRWDSLIEEFGDDDNAKEQSDTVIRI